MHFLRSFIPLLLLGIAILAPLNLNFLDAGEPAAAVTDYTLKTFRDYCLSHHISLTRLEAVAENKEPLDREQNNPPYRPSADSLALFKAACAKKHLALEL